MLVNFKQSVHETQVEMSCAFTVASSAKNAAHLTTDHESRDQRRVLISHFHFSH